MVQHALDRGYQVVGVCRERNEGKLDAFKGRITVIPGATNDRPVIKKAVAGCDGVLTVLVPWGVHHYAAPPHRNTLDRRRTLMWRGSAFLQRLPLDSKNGCSIIREL